MPFFLWFPLLFVLLSFLFDKVSLFPSVEVNAFELLHIILRAHQMHFSSIHLQPAEQNKTIKASMVSFFSFRASISFSFMFWWPKRSGMPKNVISARLCCIVAPFVFVFVFALFVSCVFSHSTLPAQEDKTRLLLTEARFLLAFGARRQNVSTLISCFLEVYWKVESVLWRLSLTFLSLPMFGHFYCIYLLCVFLFLVFLTLFFSPSLFTFNVHFSQVPHGLIHQGWQTQPMDRHQASGIGYCIQSSTIGFAGGVPISCAFSLAIIWIVESKNERSCRRETCLFLMVL